MDHNIPLISDLHREKMIKENAKIEIFNIVLHKCIEEIRETNSKSEQTFVYFKVPNIISGHSSYDKMRCVLFLMEIFTKKNYYVEFIEPQYIFIDWSVNVRDTKKIDNISYNKLQSIIPTSNPKKLKEQTKELLKKYPHANHITFVYDDQIESKPITSKVVKKKK